MNDTTPQANWIILHARDTPPPVRAAWRARVTPMLQATSPGWWVRVTLAGEDFEANAEKDERGKPLWRSWAENVPARYCGLIVPVEGVGQPLIGRATADILEFAEDAGDDAPHRLAWSVDTGTFHTIVTMTANWQGDERPWKAWSRLALDPPLVRRVGAGGTQAPATAPATRPGRQPAQRSAVGDDFIARCDEVQEYAEEVLGERNGAAAEFLAGVTERIQGMRTWAEEHGTATERMQQALENMDGGIAKWDR